MSVTDPRDLLIVPGWGARSSGLPVPNLVKTFQHNNGLVPDGIAGPKTLAACWRRNGRRLIFSPTRYPEPDNSEGYIWALLSELARLPMDRADVMTVLRHVSSQWSTGLCYLSGRDGVTIGFRRWASSGLDSLLDGVAGDYLFELFGPLGSWQLTKLGLRGRETNGWPLSDPHLRASFLVLANDPPFWRHQVTRTLDDLYHLLDRFPWTSLRLITKAFRAVNSAPGYVYGWKKRGWGPLALDQKHAEAQLDRRYTEDSEGKRRRFADIEADIPKSKRVAR